MVPPLVESLEYLVLQVLAISQPLDKGTKYPAMGVYQGKTVSLLTTNSHHPPTCCSTVHASV